MNFQDLRKANPFIFTALAQKIRNHLQINKANDQKIQTMNSEENVSNQTNKTNQLTPDNNEPQNLANNVFTKLQNCPLKQLVEQPQQTQQQRPLQKLALDRSFLKKSIHQAFMKKNQRIQKQEKLAKQRKQLQSAIQRKQMNVKDNLNYEKNIKKSIEIISVDSDSDEKEEQKIHLNQSNQDTHQNNNTKQLQMSLQQDQEKRKTIQRQLSPLQKITNKQSISNSHQVKRKKKTPYNNSNIQQNQQKLFRPQIQIKKPFRKQFPQSNKDNQSYIYQEHFRDFKDTNRFSQQSKQQKMLQKLQPFGSSGLKPYQNFHVNINLLPEVQVDVAKINQYNQIYLDTPKEKSNKQVKSADKYRQQRIEEYFGMKQKKNSSNRIHQQSDKMQEKKAQQSFNAKKSSKHIFSYPQSQLKLQNNDYEQFINRRIKKKCFPSDLGVLTIDQIVEQCYDKGIIGEEMYVQYINQSSREKIKDFINHFIDRRLNQWNFEEIKITLMDHRRLSELLVNLYPNEYVIYSPQSIQKEVNDFLTNLYLLSSQDYKSLTESLDQISGVLFWKTFKIKYQKYANNHVRVLPYTPSSTLQNNKQPSFEQQLTSQAQKDSYTAAQRDIMQKYKQQRQNKKTHTKKAKNQAYEEEAHSQQSSSDLSPDNNTQRPYGKPVKRSNKKGIYSRKRVH